MEHERRGERQRERLNTRGKGYTGRRIKGGYQGEKEKTRRKRRGIKMWTKIKKGIHNVNNKDQNQNAFLKGADARAISIKPKRGYAYVSKIISENRSTSAIR
ncbi:hypothetical protein EVAR_63239_1 [Eumeta japonica]|uniref:Uncharacterized protein n=1 Tax=Eumeta variegata TaxID=151549 RepID=A0A4C1Z5K1_EUMVA|nr:hypothetical protein EVAR_63239_1 [Eumeta japonica]